MITIASDNFEKKANNLVENLFNECSKIMASLKAKKKAALGGKSSPGRVKSSQVWECVAEEAKSSGDADALQALKEFLTEAVTFFDNNPNSENVNAAQLKSYENLQPHLLRMSKLEK